jgi:toxin YoeB
MRKDWHERAWRDYLYWQSQDKRTVRKINTLIQAIERGGQPGKAEMLKGSLAGWSSSRIDETNRFIYRIRADVLEILSCRGHYL